MKKLILVLLIATMLVGILSACNNSPEIPVKPDYETHSTITEQPSPDQNTEQNTTQDAQDSTQNITQDSTQETTQTSPEPNPIKLAELYEKYPNLMEIKNFYNGMAAFTVRTDDRYYPVLFGFIDIQGNVVIEPVYRTKNAWGEPFYYTINQYPTFEEGDYITLFHSSSEKTLYDKQGNAHFVTGENGVADIGHVYNGYFWVQTYEEQFTGDVYTTTYYSAQSMNPVATFQEYDPQGSLVADDGSFKLYKGNKPYDFNMTDYDPNFSISQPVDTWQVDVENLDDFKEVDVYYCVSSSQNSLGQIATVIIENTSNKHYFATVDSNGNLLMQPQKSISFGVDEDDPNTWNTLYNLVYEFTYCYDLCPAMDVESGKWGYIDPYGNWVIQPQYSSAKSFTEDGYAVVNSITVINTKGEIVLSGQEFTLEDILGTYSSNGDKLTLSADGVVSVKPSGFTLADEGRFVYNGELVVYDLATALCQPFNPDAYRQDGSYSIAMKDNTLIINGRVWTKISE